MNNKDWEKNQFGGASFLIYWCVWKEYHRASSWCNFRRVFHSVGIHNCSNQISHNDRWMICWSWNVWYCRQLEKWRWFLFIMVQTVFSVVVLLSLLEFIVSFLCCWCWQKSNCCITFYHYPELSRSHWRCNRAQVYMGNLDWHLRQLLEVTWLLIH